MSRKPERNMMERSVWVGVVLLLCAGQAEAISRYESASMTCAQLQATLRAEKAVIFRWRSAGNQRYARFVTSNAFCATAEHAETSYVPSADSQACAVLQCKQYGGEEEDVPFRKKRK